MVNYLGKTVHFKTEDGLTGTGLVVAEQIIKRLEPISRSKHSQLTIQERVGVNSFGYDQHTLIVEIDGYSHKVSISQIVWSA